MRERMRYVTEGPNGPTRVTKKGRRICLANRKGVTATASGGILTRHVPGKSHRFDGMASVGFFLDIERIDTPDHARAAVEGP